VNTKIIKDACNEIENITKVRARLLSSEGLGGFGAMSYTLPKQLQEAITASIKAELEAHKMKLEDVVKEVANIK